ncbi:MAG TPA: undecaprenyl-phosphate glucose phosphotransferase [Alphaproteobacteria bacterium]|nr:undecaprenyl-phosphate glucose phosphotransferase [Alphaproteobacteria bacterium]
MTTPRSDLTDRAAAERAKADRAAHELRPTGVAPAPGERPRAQAPISRKVVVGTIRFMDVVIAVSSGVAAYYFYVVGRPDARVDPYITAFAIHTLLLINIFQFSRMYQFEGLRQFFQQVGRVFLAWTSVFGLMIVLAFLAKVSDQYSRFWLVIWFSFGLFGLVLFRVILRFAFRKWRREGRLQQRVVIVGGGEHGRFLLNALRNDPEADAEVLGIFDDRGPRRVPDDIEGYQKLGSISDLLVFARTNRIDLIVVALPLVAEKRMLEILQRLWVLPVDIRLSPQTTSIRFAPQAYSYLGNVPCLKVFDKPLTDWDSIAKAVEDRVLASLILLFIAPLLITIAIAIKLDSRGPVIFRQQRRGFNNQLFELYKFRTLRHELRDDNAAKLVTKNDNRVTRVGAFLRKSSLDELPQFFNVLKGDMSVVGPRPHAMMAKAGEQLYEEVVTGYFARHRVKPGLTGWAQINGWRGETDTAEKLMRRLEFDLYYIENWSLWLDLKILLLTPFALSSTKNAY